MVGIARPQDILVTNGWYLDLADGNIGINGLFDTLEGLSQTAGTVEVVDAGTNHKYKFTDQLVDYGELTLTRSCNGSAEDKKLRDLVNTMIVTGVKLPAVSAVKLHQGKEVFRVLFEGFAFSGQTYPTFDVAGTDKFTVSYTAHCDGWQILETSI